MIKFLKNSEISKEKWDDCIDKSINGVAYAYSWYLDAAFKNWSALILNDYEAVFPMAIKSKFKINYLYQPFFTRYYGVYSKSTITQSLVNDFFNAIPNNIKFIEFNIHESNEFDHTDFQKKEHFYQLLNINKPYVEIYQNFKGDAKRNIKKAENNNLQVVDNIAPEKVVTLFRNNKGNQLKELRSGDYTLLQDIMDAAKNNKCGISIGIVNSQNVLIAAAFFIKFKNTILFLKGSANTEGKTLGAMYLIIDTLLKNYAQKAFFFDFGGSSIESIASFNHNFGAENCVYLQVKKNNLPFIIKHLSGKK